MTPHHSHHATLCASPHCRDRGRHTTNCPGGTCPGCLPRRAADGLRLCRGHTHGLARDAIEAARLRAVLAERLAGTGLPGERTSGTPDRGLRLNERAVEVRTLIRHRLVSWSLLIAEERGFHLPTRHVVEQLPDGFIGPPRLLSEVDDSDRALGEFIARSATWLAAQPYAAEASEEMRELVRLAHPVAYPTGARVFEVGPCVETGCGGTIKAILRRVDSLLPSALACDADDQHTWPADQWLTLGRQLRLREVTQ